MKKKYIIEINSKEDFEVKLRDICETFYNQGIEMTSFSVKVEK